VYCNSARECSPLFFFFFSFIICTVYPHRYDHDEVELLLEAYLQEVEAILNQTHFQQSEIEAYEGLGTLGTIFRVHVRDANVLFGDTVFHFLHVLQKSSFFSLTTQIFHVKSDVGTGLGSQQLAPD
jgi:hypothetical protein